MQKREFRNLFVAGLLVLGFCFYFSGVFSSKSLIFKIGVPLFLVGLAIIFFSGSFLGYGKSRHYLPNGKNFRKLWSHREGKIVFLLLDLNRKTSETDYEEEKSFARSDIQFYWVFARDLCNEHHRIIDTIPEFFSVENTITGIYRIIPCYHLEPCSKEE